MAREVTKSQSILTKMLFDDGQLREATLEAYFQLISENSSSSEEKLWDWIAVPSIEDNQLASEVRR